MKEKHRLLGESEVSAYSPFDKNLNHSQIVNICYNNKNAEIKNLFSEEKQHDEIIVDFFIIQIVYNLDFLLSAFK